MKKQKTEFLDDIASYYSNKLAEHGNTPQGVDWNGSESQVLRFEQLIRIVEGNDAFSINDLGCGYGGLFDYLKDRYAQFDYLGVDVSEEMITASQERLGGVENARFATASEPDREADYGVASGIFNVRLDKGEGEWAEYIENTLDVLDRTSRRGFSFNCLTLYSDEDKKRDYLYYADPGKYFDLCKRKYSRNIALLHDYDLYEFTILVRKVL